MADNQSQVPELKDALVNIPDEEEKLKKALQSYPLKIVEVGSSGTEIFAGYINEDYLNDLQGKPWADTCDKIRRSDGNAKMCARALKLPLISSPWSIQTQVESQMANHQKALFEQIFFKDQERGFTSFISEAMTMLDFGYSLFEITHKHFLHPELGNYTGLSKIGFRAQRTIETWNMENGRLKSVKQIANGDLGRFVDMDANFLLHFAPEQEGDNFEGVSIFRTMYGPWLRKNSFLKLMAVGIEKYAIPCPILEIPAGFEKSPELDAAIKAIKCYTSNQANFIALPVGWKLTIQAVTFDAETLDTVVKSEDQRMVNSILANFLLLGQNGSSGNRALGDTLSDFFGQTIRFLSDHLSERIARRVMEPLVKLNYGPNVPLLVNLSCDGIAQKADKTWADTRAVLVSAGLVVPDEKLEKFVREKYELPEKEVKLQVPVNPPQVPANTPTPTPPTVPTLAEKKKKNPNRRTVGHIDEATEALKKTFNSYLTVFGNKFVEDTLREKKRLPDSQSLKAPLNISVSTAADYKRVVEYISVHFASLTTKDVKELFKKKPKTFSEMRTLADDGSRWLEFSKTLEKFQNAVAKNYEEQIADLRAKLDSLATSGFKSETDGLSSVLINQIKSKIAVLIDSQKSDLSKALSLQYQSSDPSTDSESMLSKDLYDRVSSFTTGPVLTTGPSIMASSIVNEARLRVTQEDKEIQESVESYTFVIDESLNNCPICSELDGRTFAANDPDVARYNPPLHHLCGCYYDINLKEYTDNPDIDEEPLDLSKEALDSITLQECQGHKHPESLVLYNFCKMAS